MRRQRTDLVLILVGTCFVLLAFLAYHYLFKLKLTDFGVEILAGVLGAILMAGTMAVLLKMQGQQDRDREYASLIFQKKLDLYQRLLDYLFEIDDDMVISPKEVDQAENLTGAVALVGSKSLVSVLSQFICQLKCYGVMYPRLLTEAQCDHFAHALTKRDFHVAAVKAESLAKVEDHEDVEQRIYFYFITLDDVIQGLREDLSLVEGDIRLLIENFVRPPYDPFDMIEETSVGKAKQAAAAEALALGKAKPS